MAAPAILLEHDKERRGALERETRTIIECSPNALARFDAQVRFLYANPAFERVTGLSLEAVKGRPAREAGLGEEQAALIEANVRKVFASGAAETVRLRQGPRWYLARFVPQYNETTVLESVILYADDVTDSERAEEAATRSREELEKSFRKLQHTTMSIISLISKLVEMRDPYTAGHQRHVSQLSHAIAVELGFAADRAEGVRVAGLIHDIGKLDVPTEILNKPGRLTTLDFDLIKIHPTAGYELLKLVDFPWPVAEVAHQHQERYDGSGYPQGLKGEEIALEARIASVADVVEAMTFPRPYRAKLGLEKALHDIARGKGKLYDPACAEACLRLFAEGRFHFS